MRRKALVTGGMGYIGSNTVAELQNSGYHVVIVDNLSNSRKFIVDRIERISGIRPVFYEADICSKKQLATIFETEKNFDVVVHFAAFKAVGESLILPLKYYNNNLSALLNLLNFMQAFQCNKILFSSSATVYGNPDKLPVKETALKKALSAYGSTKLMGEDILEKVVATGSINAISLRSFNPVGAHVSALIGQLPVGVPNNLMSVIAQTAIGKQKQFLVFGLYYPTPDGSCLRDYIHVVDLAKAHVKSCDRLINSKQKNNYEVFNVGTGKGISVMEIIKAFEEYNQLKVNYKISVRRPGDAASVFADNFLALKELDWRPELGLKKMVTTAWRWELALNRLKMNYI